MKNRIAKLLAAATVATMTIAGFSACGATDTNTDADNAGTKTESQAADNNADDGADASAEDGSDVSGTVTMAGSTSMEKLASAVIEAMKEKYPNLTVTAEFTGSGAGMESLAAGSVDIGNASRALSDDEKSGGAVENIVALDGIGMITDTANKVTDISSEDLAKVYKGEITNWKDLGGDDEQIVVIGRESGSGTRDAFEELLDVADACNYAQELDSTGAVMAKVAATPGAIGYVSLDVIDESVTSMKLDGVEATEENILAGTYSLQRPFVMATMGKIEDQNDGVRAVFDFIDSEDGQSVIKSVGLIVPQK